MMLVCPIETTRERFVPEIAILEAVQVVDIPKNLRRSKWGSKIMEIVKILKTMRPGARGEVEIEYPLRAIQGSHEEEMQKEGL